MLDSGINERKSFFGYGGRTLLNWILFPLLLGYSVAFQFFPEIPVVALFGASIAAGLISLLFRNKPFLWTIFFSLSVFMGSVAWYQHQEPIPNSEWKQLPPREAQVEIEILKLFKQHNSDYVSGIAKIESINTSEDLIGLKTTFAIKTRANLNEGDLVQALGIIHYVEPISNSGFERYLKRNSVFLSFHRATLLHLTPRMNPTNSFFEKQSKKLKDCLREGAETKEDRLLSAMLTGDKTEMPDDLREAFSSAGVLHLFAVSGLHVMTVSLLIYCLLSLLRCPRLLATIIAVAATTYYVCLTGYAPSSMRALLLIYSYSIARIVSREPLLWPSLAFSALLILLISPAQLWNAGFQLSYGVTGAIALYGIPLQRYFSERIALYSWIPEKDYNWWQRHVITWQKYLCSSFAIALSAYISSSLLCIVHFQTFAIGSLLINMLIIPLAPLIIGCAVISGSLGLIGFPFLSTFFNKGGFLLIQIITHTIHITNRGLDEWTHQAFLGNLIPIVCVPLGFLCLLLPALFRKEQNGYLFLIAPIYFTVLCLCGTVMASN
jgi:competence protein ComEC